MYLPGVYHSMTNNSLEACLYLIADPHRRRIIHNLRHGATGTTTVAELVDQLHSPGSPSETGPSQDRDEFAIHLHHTHLPKLAEHGVVELDQRSGAIRYHPDEQVETVLDSLPESVSVTNP
ncbi:DUF7344 domain-containing protein [Halorarius litoreus]|uniref:DUF7344 domain-containing protein n=1 Tax=Halorarius litoreus TaxID=2962676 RepID=UPI0020CCF9B6|nr:ArsR family transcriptional regulator [Halorarius litoreus]